MTTRKTRLAGIAATVVAASLVAGTWAYTTFNQGERNEAAGNSSPGLRLHDDYEATDAQGVAVGGTINKDVYVENYGEYIQFVRIRLYEFLERGSGDAGAQTVEQIPSGATKTDDNATKVEKWRVHNFGADPVGDPDPFNRYYTLNFATTGTKLYLPTDNVAEGDATDADKADNQAEYTAPKLPNPLHDGQPKSDLYLATDKGYAAADDGGTTVDETTLPHNGADPALGVTETLALSAGLMSVTAWLAEPDASKPVNLWVYDEDGWVYWVGTTTGENPKPTGLVQGAATGLLLDSLTLNRKPESDTWTYEIYVEMQAVSAADKYGFATGGRTLTDNAWQLLETIGGFSILKPTAAAVLSATHPAVPASTSGTQTGSTPFVQNLDDLVDSDANTTPTYEVVADETTAAAAAIDLSGSTLTYTPTTEEGEKVIVVKAKLGSLEKKLTFNVNASRVANLTSDYTYTLSSTSHRYTFTASGINWTILSIDSGTAKAYVMATNVLPSVSMGLHTTDVQAETNPANVEDLHWQVYNLRAWLNGNATTDAVSDRGGSGFLQSLDDDLENRVLPTQLRTATSASGTYESTTDYVFVPSTEEYFGQDPSMTSTDLSQNFPNADSASLFAGLDLPTTQCRLRSNYWTGWQDHVPGAATVDTNGTLKAAWITSGKAIRPAMVVDLAPTP